MRALTFPLGALNRGLRSAASRRVWGLCLRIPSAVGRRASHERLLARVGSASLRAARSMDALWDGVGALGCPAFLGRLAMPRIPRSSAPRGQASWRICETPQIKQHVCGNRHEKGSAYVGKSRFPCSAANERQKNKLMGVRRTSPFKIIAKAAENLKFPRMTSYLGACPSVSEYDSGHPDIQPEKY